MITPHYTMEHSSITRKKVENLTWTFLSFMTQLSPIFTTQMKKKSVFLTDILKSHPKHCKFLQRCTGWLYNFSAISLEKACKNTTGKPFFKALTNGFATGWWRKARTTKVRFFLQCSKMQLITLQNFHIQTWFSHGHLYRWTENSFPFFLYLKPVEISKKCFNTIWTSLKVV